MFVSIDPSFSVYTLINRLNVQNIFSERRKILSHWSRLIENEIIEKNVGADVFAGFQQLEFFGPTFPRYQKIATVARNLWVFGEPDVTYSPVENLNYALLKPDDKLTREWFLVVNHPDYHRALVAQEVTPRGTPHDERMFTGILTDDLGMIEIIGDWLANSVGRTLPQ